MRTISGIGDAEEHVDAYWQGIGELVDVREYVSLSRRGVPAPEYLITRSSRFTENINPWTERHKLPRLTGGILGELIYADKPVIIDDLPARLTRDDPGWFYLHGFSRLIAFPQYDTGQALNVTVLLVRPDQEIEDRSIPTMHWQNSLFGRGTQNLVLRNQLAAAHAALDEEMRAVGEIQRSLLPPSLPEVGGYELAAHYQTSARAGGDYYDAFPIGPPDTHTWALLVADVSGHGTPAAVLMSVVRALTHARSDLHAYPSRLLGWLNEELARSYTHAGSFVTAFYAALDAPSGQLTYACAGHNPPRIVRAARPVGSLPLESGLPLGIASYEQYPQTTADLARGDLLVLYTDGITEAMAPARARPAQDARHLSRAISRDLFGTTRLDAAAAGTPASAVACVDRICRAVESFCDGQPATDDRTILALRRGFGAGNSTFDA